MESKGEPPITPKKSKISKKDEGTPGKVAGAKSNEEELEAKIESLQNSLDQVKDENEGLRQRGAKYLSLLRRMRLELEKERNEKKDLQEKLIALEGLLEFKGEEGDMVRELEMRIAKCNCKFALAIQEKEDLEIQVQNLQDQIRLMSMQSSQRSGIV
eukprot:CAMPEP_0167758532 /NCGR_PEP_ID=MMETSP0110_2-20121227/10520_1 /TAXON_ID=629695 /ORGANISM="Gymnochlora sp., Strain CCMP2014" /LENGTH=156 /DNA_ID=CAMNT_0007644817 /DNA_START=334 /DNA_END=804 /DNA_ORIENTATION=+